MQYKYAEIADTVYFWFAANDVTGTAGDGATPLYDVRLAGAAADAAPTASGTPTLLSHANYSAGLFEIAIDTTGYAAGEYAVFCTLTISTVNPAGFCGSFKLRTAGTGALNTNTISITNGAVKNASFAADVGSTAYATNIIALAADKAILNSTSTLADAATAIIDEFETQSAADPTGFKVNTVEINGVSPSVSITQSMITACNICKNC
jgi:hypothetical protein